MRLLSARTFRRIKEATLGWALMAPGLVVLAVFSFYPLIRAFLEGLYESPPFPNLPSRYVGPSHYVHVLGSNAFQSSLIKSFEYAGMTVPSSLILGTLLALLTFERIRGLPVFRLLFSSTAATSTAVASVIFFTLLNPQVGLISYLAGIRGGTGILGNPSLALPAVAMVSTWQGIGLVYILVSAGLSAIPGDLLEAASIEGAGGWQRVRHVLLPLLSPVIFLAAVVGLIGALQAFGQIDLLTQGGPLNATRVLIYYLYQEAFYYEDPSTAYVLSVVVFILVGALTALQFWLLQRRVYYAARR